MAAEITASFFKQKAPPRSTEKVFLGRRFELCAFVQCRKKGYRLIQKNLHCSLGEVDLLFWNPRVGELIVVEVRGIKKGAVGEFRPVHTLAAAKVARLERMALHWGRIYRAPVRVEFFEVIGKPPGRWCPEWFAKILFCFPRWLGLEIKQYRILG